MFRLFSLNATVDTLSLDFTFSCKLSSEERDVPFKTPVTVSKPELAPGNVFAYVGDLDHLNG